MKAYGIIYKITNKVNGKCYIGQTRLKLRRRISNHFRLNAPLKGHLRYAIVKYGRDAFVVEELFHAFTKDSLDWAERSYIQLFKSYDRRYGYNFELGGVAGSGKATPELRKKLSSIQRQMHGRPVYVKNINSGEELYFSSIGEASEKTNVPSADIHRIAGSTRLSAKGFTFRFEGKVFKDIPAGYRAPNMIKPVIRVNLITGEEKVYASGMGTESDGFDHRCVSDCCSKKRRTHGGYMWYYAGDAKPTLQPQRTVAGITRPYLYRPIVGKNITTGIEIKYLFIREAAKDGFLPPCIHKCLKGGQPSHKGYTWRDA